jgi:Piwi domain.
MILVPTRLVRLNRYAIRPLLPDERTLFIYALSLDSPPNREDPQEVYRVLNRAARGVGGVYFGGRLYAFNALSATEGVTLTFLESRPLRPEEPLDREVATRLLRRKLEEALRLLAGKRGLLLEGKQVYRPAPRTFQDVRLYQGASLDVQVSRKGQVLLAVDLVTRIQANLSLEAWLRRGYPLPGKAANRYPSQGQVLTWTLRGLSEEPPEAVLIQGGQTLLDYHRSRGHLAPGDDPGRVVLVSRKGGPVLPHLSALLVPVLTLEELAQLGVPPEALGQTRHLEERFTKGQEWARILAPHLGAEPGHSPEPLRVEAQVLPPARLVAAEGRKVNKPMEALTLGVYRRGSPRLACLLWPGEAPPEKALARLQALGAELAVRPLPEGDGDRRALFRALASDGIAAALVVLPPGDARLGRFLEKDDYYRLKDLAHRAGLPLQLLRRGEDPYRVANALLGLLVKAGWQPVALEGDYPADLVIGLDSSGDGRVHYGAASFAVLADGTPLGWVLPQAQPGESMDRAWLWRAVEETVAIFSDKTGRLPKRILLLRDGLAREQEFADLWEGLAKMHLAHDLFTVRKRHLWRMAPGEAKDLMTSLSGTLLQVDRRTWLMVTADRVWGKRRDFRVSPRPLLLVHERGDGPSQALLRQIFHLSQFHPASASLYPRLPVPLHFAHKLAKSAGRWGAMGLARLPADSLFFV